MLQKTRLLLGLGLVLLTAVLSSFHPVKPAPKPVRTIIIDAGHGGRDQGAAGLQSTEAQICLALSMKLCALIEKEMPGVKVLYTRTTDIIPGNSADKNAGLRYRAEFANQSQADLFLSIHCNSAGRAPGGWNERRITSYTEKTVTVGKGKKARKETRQVPVYETVYVPNAVKGTETFIWTASENAHKGQIVGSHSEFSSEEDSTILLPENDPVLNSLKLLYTKKYFANSFRLADLVQQEFERSGRINRGVKQRNEKGIWVLHATGMPSILIETGFISNTEEEEYMLSETGQQEIVEDIAAALKAYIAQVDKQPATPAKPMSVEGMTSFLQSLEQHCQHSR